MGKIARLFLFNSVDLEQSSEWPLVILMLSVVGFMLLLAFFVLIALRIASRLATQSIMM